MVILQTNANNVRPIIFLVGEGSVTKVASFFRFWGSHEEIILDLAGVAEASTHKPLNHKHVRNFQQNQSVNIVRGKEQAGLRQVPGIAIQDETMVPIMFLQAEF